MGILREAEVQHGFEAAGDGDLHSSSFHGDQAGEGTVKKEKHDESGSDAASEDVGFLSWAWKSIAGRHEEENELNRQPPTLDAESQVEFTVLGFRFDTVRLDILRHVKTKFEAAHSANLPVGEVGGDFTPKYGSGRSTSSRISTPSHQSSSTQDSVVMVATPNGMVEVDMRDAVSSTRARGDEEFSRVYSYGSISLSGLELEYRRYSVNILTPLQTGMEDSSRERISTECSLLMELRSVVAWLPRCANSSDHNDSDEVYSKGLGSGSGSCNIEEMSDDVFLVCGDRARRDYRSVRIAETKRVSSLSTVSLSPPASPLNNVSSPAIFTPARSQNATHPSLPYLSLGAPSRSASCNKGSAQKIGSGSGSGKKSESSSTLRDIAKPFIARRVQLNLPTVATSRLAEDEDLEEANAAHDGKAYFVRISHIWSIHHSGERRKRSHCFVGLVTLRLDLGFFTSLSALYDRCQQQGDEISTEAILSTTDSRGVTSDAASSQANVDLTSTKEQNIFLIVEGVNAWIPVASSRSWHLLEIARCTFSHISSRSACCNPPGNDLCEQIRATCLAIRLTQGTSLLDQNTAVPPHLPANVSKPRDIELTGWSSSFSSCRPDQNPTKSASKLCVFSLGEVCVELNVENKAVTFGASVHTILLRLDHTTIPKMLELSSLLLSRKMGEMCSMHQQSYLYTFELMQLNVSDSWRGDDRGTSGSVNSKLSLGMVQMRAFLGGDDCDGKSIIDFSRDEENPFLDIRLFASKLPEKLGRLAICRFLVMPTANKTVSEELQLSSGKNSEKLPNFTLNVSLGDTKCDWFFLRRIAHETIFLIKFEPSQTRQKNTRRNVEESANREKETKTQNLQNWFNACRFDV